MNFAKKLSEARKAKNMSRKELADKVMRSQSAIKSWEIGKHIPPENIQRKLEAALKLPAGGLVADYDERVTDVLFRLNQAVHSLEGSEKERVLILIESLVGVIE